jgi:hypothetical protein
MPLAHGQIGAMGCGKLAPMDLRTRPQMSRLVTALVLLLIGSAAYAAPDQDVRPMTSPFVKELNRQCPGRGLHNLSAGDLELIMEGFGERLTPTQRHKIEDTVGYRCARIEAGVTCANSATLDAYRQLDVLRSFVHEACATKWTCKAFADCAQTQP